MPSSHASQTSLTPQQSSALFEILSHHQLSSEISKFTYPTGIDHYGPPFDSGDPNYKGTSSSPILQSLVTKFVTTLPGLKDVGQGFWKDRAGVLVKKLGEAALSESYDKGRIGSRRVLAAASACVLEGPARGVLGGLRGSEEGGEKSGDDEEYDVQDPDDLIKAWDKFLHGIVYGDMIDRVFDRVAETDRLEEHEPLVKAVHEYLIVNFATFLHYVMIHSPDGPYIARLLDNVHKLIPYTMMRSTLRVGNAATMINGMVRIILTKLSVGAVTNWLGLSKGADDGMNLLQQIVSQVITWDINELRKQASKLESSKDAPPKQYFKSISKHLQKSRKECDDARSRSIRDERSLVAVIFEDDGLSLEKLSEAQHTVALDFLSLQLSIRDREQLIKLSCNLQPDILTQGIKDIVAAYDFIIRGVHNAADLSTGFWDFECFLTDLIKLSKPQTVKKNNEKPAALPCVEEYAALLRKHMPGAHRFAHQVAKNGKEVTQQYRQYAKDAAQNFRQQRPGSGDDAAGDMTKELDKLVEKLEKDQQKKVLDALDEYSAYTIALSCSSRDRLSSVLSNASKSFSRSSSRDRNTSSRPSSSRSSSTSSMRKTGTTFGPGMYLPKLQQLIDTTPITPKTAQGPVRHGADRSVRDNEAVDVDGSRKVTSLVSVEELGVKAPDVSIVTELLGKKFESCIR